MNTPNDHPSGPKLLFDLKTNLLILTIVGLVILLAMAFYEVTCPDADSAPEDYHLFNFNFDSPSFANIERWNGIQICTSNDQGRIRRPDISLPDETH